MVDSLAIYIDIKSEPLHARIKEQKQSELLKNTCQTTKF